MKLLKTLFLVLTLAAGAAACESSSVPLTGPSAVPSMDDGADTMGSGN